MDIRYRQRFANYSKALEQLEKGLRYFEQEQEHEELAEVIRTSVIKSFEFSFELAWNLMKDYAIYQGIPNVAGSRDAIREAFSMGLISEEMQFTWKEMILSRNQSSHIYNESTAEDIFRKIKEEYMDAFYEFWQTMKTRQDE
ncbi:nucleotidyltransferase substrate binding protein [Bergeyella zoohelcum]|uniref:HI0074 family nucleotidyltransferase substrate binding protein n=1 Tax=Bergeyella zoohelcum ATCC 43767 TaxID=883096 RepID=K1M731_9FLAO|nr:nucleotidyltransferase substrate binding protein [Bergeyella zoohelcum]EKB58163.1 HI0074 family nucleotidyltransferase substrate binding protein [Bergeyella zoohelcum ATCC 43767]SUV49160.1 nucleotidyltransferase substrate binding protein, HI0074 family [Bergeyella zoohelcum]